MSDDDQDLKQLQRECGQNLALYIRLAETVGEILTRSATAPLTPSDRARVRGLSRAEMAALKAYLAARVRLMTALSLEALPEFQLFRNALSAADHSRSSTQAGA